MDPQNNQAPQPPDGGLSEDQPPLPPRPQPDWQQGLGTPAPQQTPPSGTVIPSVPGPAPTQTYGPTPSNMPAQQPAMPAGQPVVPATGGEMPPTMMMPAPKNKKGMKILLAILMVLAIAAIVAVSYLMFFKKDNSANQSAKKSTSSVKATDLATLNDASLDIPGGITGYTEKTTTLTTAKDFMSADSTCEFVVGTATSAQLPGADLDAIVKSQIDQLKALGYTVNGPTAGTALTVKDSASSSVTYSMPTVNYELANGEKHATVHYSAVIMKGSNRAFVNRSCANQQGAVDASKITALDNTAKNVVVTKK
ncbi:MAG TPA: hypothetical protein VMR45_04840 [Patescibacteria group bacterium]|nr:hypothetical protein [Patescibacteria group bacterium]